MQRYFIVLFFITLGGSFSFAQNNSGISDTIEYIQDSDTIKEIVIEEVMVSDEYSIKLTKEEKEQLKLLQKRVRVVYPYAKLTAEKLVQINSTMAKLKTEKERKKYFKIAEKYLNDEFEPKLKKLSQKQGQILVKLIHRQTGITTFDLIKDYKSGWKAFWSNKTAQLFNINLKKEYNPMEVPEDYYIETFLIKCFAEGKLVKQPAAKPINEDELTENWIQKNRAKVQAEKAKVND
ncbi:Protein of unknown function precursor [Flavobacterium indicum GPTSA100-9 = DSM 17447]|uniref:DUF4294 domain-containing protein n=1 Tax=Flavobacterium indicum (strain DSM 17447 / CIP 109464 / GPTSA100-9) TaxID=1094466 RepID=H8XTG1_FLAIG|nr:DUF4294 domain-containing protein [Flavobacterium indicum]CCG52758.1 Protein of unknown function precursor [Flavobacterium indicum GPTSA100-9 = DSM 17447]